MFLKHKLQLSRATFCMFLWLKNLQDNGLIAEALEDSANLS
jgi:hypothetical protein